MSSGHLHSNQDYKGLKKYRVGFFFFSLEGQCLKMISQSFMLFKFHHYASVIVFSAIFPSAAPPGHALHVLSGLLEGESVSGSVSGS